MNWEANSALLGWRAGPVRAIREVWGADSGTNVTKTETFYQARRRVPLPPAGPPDPVRRPLHVLGLQRRCRGPLLRRVRRRPARHPRRRLGRGRAHRRRERRGRRQRRSGAGLGPALLHRRARPHRDHAARRAPPRGGGRPGRQRWPGLRLPDQRRPGLRQPGHRAVLPGRRLPRRRHRRRARPPTLARRVDHRRPGPGPATSRPGTPPTRPTRCPPTPPWASSSWSTGATPTPRPSRSRAPSASTASTSSPPGDTDNAFCPVTSTEIDGQQWRFAVPMSGAHQRGRARTA